MIGKTEHLDKGSNPCFIVTSLDAAESCTQTLYERLYCARGEMENRIKECQHGKPPLRRQHHYRKIVSYHPIPPAKPASPGSR